MSLTLFGFGDDITRVRKEIDVNIKLLKNHEIKEELIDSFIRLLSFNDSWNENYKDTSQDKIKSHLALLPHIIIQTFIEIKQNLFSVNPASVAAIEAIYLFENAASILEKPYEYGFLQQLLKKIDRIRFFLFQEFTNAFLTEDDLKVEEVESKWSKPLSQHDDDFDYFFAFTLRQMPTQQVTYFLLFQNKVYEPKLNFPRFLKTVLLEYGHIIPQKNQVLAYEYIEWLSKRIEENKKTIEQEKVSKPNPPQVEVIIGNHGEEALLNTDKLITDNPFSTPPFDFFEIPGRLKPKDIRLFFSFLWCEKNGTNEPFATDPKLIEHLMNYGLKIPLEPLKSKFELNLDTSRKTKKIIYYSLYLLYSKHPYDLASKQYFAQFIANTFSNFEKVDSRAILSNLRKYSFKPKQLQFDFNNYLQIKKT